MQKQITHVKPTGRLENWEMDAVRSILWGNLYDDEHGRWREGQMIHTSYISGLLGMDLKEGVVVQTLNSTYLLGTPAI